MTTSPSMTTTSRRICSARTPCPCSTVWKHGPTRRGLEFGLKLTNTFPVDVTAGELPSEEMYMSGQSLFPLTTAMAARLSREFDGKLRISYAGGADAFNIDKLFACGHLAHHHGHHRPEARRLPALHARSARFWTSWTIAPFGGVDVPGDRRTGPGRPARTTTI